ncbi:MAG: alpha/beta hydrolase [Clostridia bacterium]
MRALLTIHGFLTDKTDFDGAIDVISPTYDHIEHYTIPGHTTPRDYTKFSFTQTLAGLLDTYDGLSKYYDQIDCLGFSLGGALATYLANTRKLNKLILLSPANKYLNFGTTFRWLAFYAGKTFQMLGENKGKLTNINIFDDSSIAPYIEDNKKAINIAIKELIPNYNVRNLFTFNRLVKHCNSFLQENDCPTLILYGKLDEMVPYGSITMLENYFRQAKVHIFDDVGHMMLRSSRANAIAEVIKEFINN